MKLLLLSLMAFTDELMRLSVGGGLFGPSLRATEERIKRGMRDKLEAITSFVSLGGGRGVGVGAWRCVRVGLRRVSAGGGCSVHRAANQTSLEGGGGGGGEHQESRPFFFSFSNSIRNYLAINY